jgi:hypothetical protein
LSVRFIANLRGAPTMKTTADADGLDLTNFITQAVDLKHTQEGLDILSRKKENVVKVIVEF